MTTRQPPRPHAYWPDASGLSCQSCGLPRAHPHHDIQPLEPARLPYRDNDQEADPQMNDGYGDKHIDLTRVPMNLGPHDEALLSIGAHGWKFTEHLREHHDDPMGRLLRHLIVSILDAHGDPITTLANIVADHQQAHP